MKAEDIFQLAFGTSGEAALLVDIDKNRILDSNATANVMFGVSQDEFKGFDYHSIVPNDNEIPLWLMKSKSMSTFEFFLGKNKQVFPAEVSKYDIKRTPTKNFVAYVLRDISKKREEEFDIFQTVDSLKEANISKDKFFAIVAHDLKNTLQALLIGSHLLAVYFNKKSYSKLSSNIGEISETIQSMSIQLEDLLQWSKTQTGKIFYIPEIIKVSEIINESVGNAILAADKKGIKLRIDELNRCFTYSDRFLISETIKNLLSNAVKYTNADGEIRISIDDIPGFYQINISDTGIGITDEDLKKLFRIDADLCKPGTENEIGAGIGLMLCREFVEKNGGAIFAKSEPGAGSTFSFTVPKLPDAIG